MLRLLFIQVQECINVWKLHVVVPCHVGIYWKAHTEYHQMSTNVPGCLSFFGFFCIIFSVPLESIFCYSNTFENYFEIKQKFKSYLMKSYCLAIDLHFSFIFFFSRNTFVSKTFPKLSGLFLLLSV